MFPLIATGFMDLKILILRRTVIQSNKIALLLSDEIKIHFL